jgi:hypothetical protein
VECDYAFALLPASTHKLNFLTHAAPSPYALLPAPQVDFLVTLMRDVLGRRPDLKLVLMSATLSAQVLMDYFRGCPGGGCHVTEGVCDLCRCCCVVGMLAVPAWQCPS